MWEWEEASSPGCRAIRPRKPLGCACNRCVAPLIVSPALGRLCPTPTSANTFCFSHVRASRARGCGTGASPSATASPDAGPGTPHPPPAPLGSAAAARRTQPSKPSSYSLTGMEISSHQFHLLEQLNEQRKQDLFCDCNILVEGKVFKAHRNVLFASSGYFKMLLSQSSKETSQPTIATFEVFSPETFMVILDFVYSGILSLTGQNVIEVMSAASYLQMTDILNVCKTFIKSSLDINEKEKDHYLSLSAKSTNSEPVRPSLYRSRRKAKSNPRRSYSIPEEKANTVNENSWSSYSSYLSSQVILQQAETQLSKRGRKQASTRKRRKHLGLSQTRDFVQYKSNKVERASGGCSASDPSHISQVREEDEFNAENNVDHDDYRYNHESEVIPKRWTVAQLEQELSRTPEFMELKAEELTTSVPAILGIMGSWNEDDLPRMRFKCPFCTHTVKRRADLKRHLRCHTGERPYPCEVCGKRFTRLEHLRNHFQTIHQACKLICRKCKHHVTELTGCVVQQGTRRYRLCHKCLAEANFDSIPDDLDAEHSPVSSMGNKRSKWASEEEQKSDEETMEEEPYNLVVRHVNDDTPDEVDEKVKPNLRGLGKRRGLPRHRPSAPAPSPQRPRLPPPALRREQSRLNSTPDWLIPVA
ncbi:zinc finger and BTB domain-containing protein 8A isoform X2 [Tyto alba]|uniref:zinc finger and BTB domain-containing protein 8A isoform X2 n=1 Tax=Tyto alba TaxID=56313 RepID=UPI001C66CD63|nr:zinc finger and BTB domain-containing protein 8A isoform X2 [Tyto alba]